MSEQPHTGGDEQDDVSMLEMQGNEAGASSDGDTGPEGAHNDPKPGNEDADEEADGAQ